MANLKHDIVAERSWLACVVYDSRLFSNNKNINSEWFFHSENRVVFEKINDLVNAGKPVDIVTVFGDADVLREKIMSEYFNIDNVDEYASILESKYLTRYIDSDLRKTLSSIDMNDDKDIKDVIGSIASRMINITNNYSSQDSMSHISTISDDVSKILKNARRGISQPYAVPSGVSFFQDKIDGFMPGDMVTIAARPAQGKTSLALQMALQMSNLGKSVGFISLEMPKKQLYIRLMSSLTGIDFQRIIRGQFTDIEAKQLVDAKDKIDSSKLIIDDPSFMNEVQMASAIRRMKYSYGVSAVFIDYLQLVDARGKQENRQREISIISRHVKGLAMELGITILPLSQLKREVDTRENKRPTLADLRESGSIEQDSDIIAFIYRPEIYHIAQWDDNTPTAGTAEVIVAKYRNGETFSVRTAYSGRKMRFDRLAYDYDNKNSF